MSENSTCNKICKLLKPSALSGFKAQQNWQQPFKAIHPYLFHSLVVNTCKSIQIRECNLHSSTLSNPGHRISKAADMSSSVSHLRFLSQESHLFKTVERKMPQGYKLSTPCWHPPYNTVRFRSSCLLVLIAQSASNRTFSAGTARCPSPCRRCGFA